VDILSPERHCLVLYRTSARQQGRTTRWITDALARGEKVLHRVVDPEAWVDLEPSSRAARDSGQLELVDAREVHEETGGRHWALRELHRVLVREARRAGYPGVLLTADEHAMAVIAPEPAERLAHEHDLTRLTADPGVRALCCYDLRVEQPDLLDAVVGAHYRGVDDVLWSAGFRAGDDGGVLLVRGEIDAGNAGRFGAALRAAVTHGVQAVDLSEVSVLSAAGIRAFDGAVDLLRRKGERLRLVNLSDTVRRVLTMLRVPDDGELELVTTPPVPVDDSRLAAIARQLTELTASLLHGSTVAAVLHRVTEAALDLVSGADMVSITLRGPDGTFHTPIHTDEMAYQLDQLQYTFGEGPCVDAARVPGPAVAVSHDLAVEPAWPRFGPAAAAHGMRSVVATALLPDAEPPQLSGALNIYSRRPGGLSETDRDIALILAGHASLALAATEATSLRDLRNIRLRQAIDSRAVLGHAKGILMQRRGVSADEAFAVLRRMSQHLNVKLADLAHTLASRTELDLPAEPQSQTDP